MPAARPNREKGARYNSRMDSTNPPGGAPAAASDRPATIAGSVFLVGMMGAGKTSVGKLLAQRLGKRFVDADQEIEARCGVTIPVIFEIEGEQGFRQRERAIIDELTQQPDIVLATGGGAVLAEDSRARLHSRGVVVYLKTSASEIWQRTRRDRGRPLLATADPQQRIVQLLAEREPLYAAVAHITVESTQDSVKAMVNRLVDRLARHAPCTAVETHAGGAADAGDGSTPGARAA